MGPNHASNVVNSASALFNVAQEEARDICPKYIAQIFVTHVILSQISQTILILINAESRIHTRTRLTQD